MNKLNNFFANWKGSDLFLSLFIGVSVVASTAAASGGFKLPGSINQVNSGLAQVGGEQAQASTVNQGSDANNTPQEVSFPVTALAQNIERAGSELNNQSNRAAAVAPVSQTVNSINNSTSSSDIQTASADASAADATSTTQNNTLPSFNSQTLMVHNKAGDCYVAYQGRVYNVSGEAVWNTCNYGIPGGADVTAGFPDSANYFSSLPLVGTYYDANYSATANINNNNNTATTTNSNTNNNQTATSTASANNTAATSTGTSQTTITHRNTERGGDDNNVSNQTSSGSQNNSTTSGSSGRSAAGRSGRRDD